MFEELYNNKKVNKEKLLKFGFKEDNDLYKFYKIICDNSFILTIIVDKNGKIETDLQDINTHEDYPFYKTYSSGPFISKLKSEIEDELKIIISSTYEDQVFKSRQAKMIISYIKEKYNDEIEFLWPKSPNNAISRNKDSAKWYLALLTLDYSKLVKEKSGIVEIIDLRMNKDDKDSILSTPNFYPGWHMNKDSWFTIILDNSVCDDILIEMVNKSYLLSKK